MGEGSREWGEWRSDRRFCRGRQQLQVEGEGEATGVCGRKRGGRLEVNVHVTFLNETAWWEPGKEWDRTGGFCTEQGLDFQDLSLGSIFFLNIQLLLSKIKVIKLNVTLHSGGESLPLGDHSKKIALYPFYF
jgi:hypothetical protein